MESKPFASFLKNCDPRPPMLEDKGNRSILGGILGLLLVPAFFLFIATNLGSTYQPAKAMCLCPSKGLNTTHNQWLFDLAAAWPLDEYDIHTYEGAGTRLDFSCSVAQREYVIQISDSAFPTNLKNWPISQLLTREFLTKCRLPSITNMKQPVDVELHSFDVTCGDSFPGDRCTSSCSRTSSLWFPPRNGGSSGDAGGIAWSWAGTNTYNESDATIMNAAMQLMGRETGCGPGIGVCMMQGRRNPNTFGIHTKGPIRALCELPSIAGVLAVLGSGIGLVMGLMVQGPSGVRFIWRNIKPASDYIGSKKDYWRGVFISLYSFYFGLIWSHMTHTTQMQRHGSSVGFAIIGFGLSRAVLTYFEFIFQGSAIAVLFLAIWHIFLIYVMMAGMRWKPATVDGYINIDEGERASRSKFSIVLLLVSFTLLVVVGVVEFGISKSCSNLGDAWWDGMMADFGWGIALALFLYSTSDFHVDSHVTRWSLWACAGAFIALFNICFTIILLTLAMDPDFTGVILLYLTMVVLSMVLEVIVLMTKTCMKVKDFFKLPFVTGYVSLSGWIGVINVAVGMSMLICMPLYEPLPLEWGPYFAKTLGLVLHGVCHLLLIN